MTPTRRGLLGAAALAPLARPAVAQDAFPNRPITIITGAPAGGLTDVSTRAIAERMGAVLGQPIVVENRTGGAASIAPNHVVGSRPDGYTLLGGTSSLAINPTLLPNLPPRDPRAELLPIAFHFRSPFVLHVHPSLPVRNVADLVAYAKARPGELAFGSSGAGAVNHLAMELLRNRAGIEVLHVPYRGGVPALIDLRQNRIGAMFQSALEAIPVVREGATRAIAVSGLDRIAPLPEVPPVADTLPGFDAVFWQGLFAPVGTPAPVVARLAAATTAATDDPGVRSRLGESGVIVGTGDAAMLARVLAEETESWGRLIREANIKPE